MSIIDVSLNMPIYVCILKTYRAAPLCSAILEHTEASLHITTVQGI
jgi:hypothetical protein